MRIFPGFSRIRTEHGTSVFSPNARKSEKNGDQNNSEYGLFLGSDSLNGSRADKESMLILW